MSGSAGLSAAKRRRAEQALSPSQTTRQSQPISNTPQARAATPKILTPMSILEDHELRLRYIESFIKECDANAPATENKDDTAESSSSSPALSDNKDVSVLNRIVELETSNEELRKKIVSLETDLVSVSNKHSILQTFAMETNESLLKHKDAFEPGVVIRLINMLLDKTTNTPPVEVVTETQPESQPEAQTETQLEVPQEAQTD